MKTKYEGLSFIKYPNSKQVKPKLIYGKGKNNSTFKMSYTENGFRIKSKAYVTWYNMIERCYSERKHKISPSYIECSVSKEWLLFTNFEKWFDINYIEGYHLDKDLKVENNKIYSPETSCFIPQWLNQLFVKPNKPRKDSIHLGVSKHNTTNKFRNNFGPFIKLYDTPEEAEYEYYKSKGMFVLNKLNNLDIPKNLRQTISQRAFNMITKSNQIFNTNNFI